MLNVLPMGESIMTMEYEARRHLSPLERRAQLKQKGELNLAEAAEYLRMAPKTLRNRLYKAREPGNEGEAPRGNQTGRRVWFQVSELDAWLKKNTRKI